MHFTWSQLFSNLQIGLVPEKSLEWRTVGLIQLLYVIFPSTDFSKDS